MQNSNFSEGDVLSILLKIDNEEVLSNTVDVWFTISGPIPGKKCETTKKLSNNTIQRYEEGFQVLLTQEDTVGFDKGTYEYQCRGLLNDGSTFRSKIGTLSVSKVLNRSVIKVEETTD